MGFSNGYDRVRLKLPAGRVSRSVVLLLPILLLAGCGQPGGYGPATYGAPGYGTAGIPEFAPTHYYPPPGPPEDPWGPYIREASRRYGVPEQWVRAVMQQESGGEEQAVSPVGAMGLMQVMPQTYEGLRERYSLGGDPFDPHNNILAGTAYIREMYDRFGAPGFLAAYNAGPDRVDAYLAGTSGLPDETVNYLASVTPNLGNAVPLSGPLAMYASASGGGRLRPDAQSLAAGCDLNAAYDPAHPCSSLMRAATAPAPVLEALAVQTGVGGCNLSAAYDPAHPCTSVGSAMAASATPPASRPTLVAQAGAGGCDLSAAYDPNHPCTSAGRTFAAPAPPPAAARPMRPVSPNIELASAEGCDPTGAFDPGRPCRGLASPAASAARPAIGERPLAEPPFVADHSPAGPAHRLPHTATIGGASHLLAIPDRDWGIQVGAFASSALARAVAEGARSQAPGQLHAAAVALPPIADGGSVLYRARLVNLSASAAENACTNLNRHGLPCVVVQPNRA